MKPKKVITNALPSKQTPSAVLTEKMDRLLNDVRVRAYELFEQRGRVDGYELDDWFQAQADLGVLQLAKLEETETEVRIRIERSAFNVDQLQVHAEPHVITVEGSAIETEGADDSPNRTVSERTLYGRFSLPSEINTESVTARLDDGVLEIVASKMNSTAEKPPKCQLFKPQVEKSKSAGAPSRSGTSAHAAALKV